MPAALQLAASALSHTGCVRRNNQDSWSYSLEAGVFVVCDGMGGAAGGEIASRTAVETFLEHLGATPPAQRSPKAIGQAVCAANRRVQARAAYEPALKGMGTTLVALAMHRPGELALVHVGDSRCYRWRAGSLTCETEDHSLIAEQLRMGVIDEEQAATSPMRNVITRSVGTRRAVEPEIRGLAVEPGDVLLLCSDGLTRELPDATIAEFLALPMSLEARNEGLIAAALATGGHDNVTTLLVEIGDL